MLDSDPQLSLSIAGKQVEQVREAELLGIVLEPKLNWTKHMGTTKMGRSIAITRKCSKYIQRNILKEVTQALVLSHLEYCPAIWSSASNKDMQKLQIAQNKAARLALQRSKCTYVTEMHKNLPWLPVENRLHFRILTSLQKVLIDKRPQHFYDQVEYKRDVHNHMTRQAGSGYTEPLNREQNYLHLLSSIEL